jgi:hypothetical protein
MSAAKEESLSMVTVYYHPAPYHPTEKEEHAENLKDKSRPKLSDLFTGVADAITSVSPQPEKREQPQSEQPLQKYLRTEVPKNLTENQRSLLQNHDNVWTAFESKLWRPLTEVLTALPPDIFGNTFNAVLFPYHDRTSIFATGRNRGEDEKKRFIGIKDFSENSLYTGHWLDFEIHLHSTLWYGNSQDESYHKWIKSRAKDPLKNAKGPGLNIQAQADFNEHLVRNRETHKNEILNWTLDVSDQQKSIRFPGPLRKYFQEYIKISTLYPGRMELIYDPEYKKNWDSPKLLLTINGDKGDAVNDPEWYNKHGGAYGLARSIVSYAITAAPHRREEIIQALGNFLKDATVVKSPKAPRP